jgi:hypothetical protein
MLSVYIMFELNAHLSVDLRAPNERHRVSSVIELVKTLPLRP